MAETEGDWLFPSYARTHCCFAGCDTCPNCGGCRRVPGLMVEGCQCPHGPCTVIPFNEIPNVTWKGLIGQDLAEGGEESE